MCRLPVEGLRVPASKPAPGQRGGQQYDDEFLQYTYKVVPCDKTWRHDYATCPFAHAGESSERRHPSAYLPFMCGSTQHSTDLKEKCPFGTACKYAHGHFELWLHPGRFRTKLCSLGANCKRPVCFFAHSEQELRVTPYSKLDTAASVAAQQLAEMGQDLDGGHSATSVGLLGGSCSSITSDVKVRPASSVNSPGSSECGGGKHGSNSSSTSPTNSMSLDEAAALAKLTASMAALNTPAGPLLDVGGIARLQNNAYLAAAAAAVDASLSGSADMSLSGHGLWHLAGSNVLQQQQQAQQQLPSATVAYNSPYLQQQVPVLDPQMLTSGALAGSVAASSSDMWLMPQTAANSQWPAVSAAAAARTMLAQQQQQQQRAFGLGAAAPAAPCATRLAPGLTVPTLLAPAGLDQWLQLEALQANQDGSCYPAVASGLCGVPAAVACSMSQQQQASAGNSQAQAMQQLLNQQAVQQLLGLIDAQAAH